MKIITRDWIHKDAHFFAFQRGFKVQALYEIIDYWKKKLVEHGALPGHKIGLAAPVHDIAYVALTFAAFELGLKLVILLKPITEKELNDLKFKAHLPLDVLVLDQWAIEDPKIKDHFVRNSKIIVPLKTIDYLFFTMDRDHLKYRNKIDARPDEDLILCTSSGTTGVPKLVNHSHKFLYDLCTINRFQLEFEEEDRCLHLATFNHGSSLSIFFLPALKTAKWHYFNLFYGFSATSNEESNWDKFVEFCKKNKITKILCPFSLYTDHIISAIGRDKEGLPNLTLMVLSFINPKWLPTAQTGKLKKIVSIYGCTETGGPLFLPYIDQNTNKINPKFLGQPIDGFYDIKIIDNSLTVKLPDGVVVETEDFISQDKNGCTFISKKKMARINDVEINPNDIIELFEKHIPYVSRNSLVIIVDEIYNNLYVVTNNQTLTLENEKMKSIIKDFYSNRVELAAIMYIESLNYSVVGIKPDKERILDYIRQRNNEQY